MLIIDFFRFSLVSCLVPSCLLDGNSHPSVPSDNYTHIPDVTTGFGMHSIRARWSNVNICS